MTASIILDLEYLPKEILKQKQDNFNDIKLLKFTEENHEIKSYQP